MMTVVFLLGLMLYYAAIGAFWVLVVVLACALVGVAIVVLMGLLMIPMRVLGWLFG